MPEELKKTNAEPAAGELSPAGASTLVEVDLAALTDRGKVRDNNEDHYIVARFDRAMRTLLTNLPKGQVPASYAETVYGLLVADGVGGQQAGEVASRTAIQAIVDLVIDTPDWIMRLDEPLEKEVLDRMERRFQKVRGVLVERAQADPKLRGMATTLTVACSLGPVLLTTHVGDTRAYLFRGGKLTRLTRDQTMAQSLADAGAIRPDQIAAHPMRHVLTSALAARHSFMQVEVGRWSLEDGDRLLLCSDGLTEMVSESAIAGVLSDGTSSEAACRKLVDLALEGGGEDNVTVVLARYRIPEAARA
ncbi:MAG TPA: protein phosphatase 2C domain-containing protein [Thermoanaerobaculia bacterium]|nr:protein phosphatase 2C domain-containing protein [Thermoanaerobaculia bacterium]